MSRNARRDMGAAALGLAVLVGTTACGGDAAAGTQPTFATAPVIRTDLRITAEATGLVEPVRTVEVKSKASGEILRLHVDVGDRVQLGDLLADVDPRDVRNAFDQAEADLEVAEARVEIAQAQLQRSTELLEAGVITQQEHEGSNLEAANARAGLVRAQTNLELARLRLGDVTIRAPLAGTIILKSVEEGQVIQSATGNVSGGTTLFQMANLDEMQVRTLVDETDVGQLAAGMETTVRVEAFPDRSFLGVIEKIEPQAEVQQNVTMFPVIVQLDNRAGLLKPGMNAEVEVLVAEQLDVLTVPNNAIVEPNQMAPAAELLGLDPGAIQIDRRALRGGPMGPTDGASGASQSGERTAERTPEDGAEARATGEGRPGARAGGFAANLTEEERARFQQLRRQAQAGEITQDSLRAAIGSLRGAAPGGAPGGVPGAGAVAQRPDGAQPAPADPRGQGEGTPSRGRLDGRVAIAFVVHPDGTIEPRPIRLGLGDWDQTSVLAGLQEGEAVAVIGAAQLQAQQQEFLDRMRERAGGGPFGGGGFRR